MTRTVTSDDVTVYLDHDVRDVKDGANDGVDAAWDNDQSFSGVDQRLAGDLYRRSSRLHSSTHRRPAGITVHSTSSTC